MRKYLEDFILFIEKEKGYSINTVKSYEDNILEFIMFLSDKNIDNLNRINHNILREYLSELYHHGYSKKTIALNISSLRSFFKFLEKENLINDNPITLISNPKMDKRLPRIINYADLDELLNKPNDTVLGIRDKAMLELLYSTGIRVSELVNIKLCDISLSNKQIKVLGKGNKERYVLFGSICKEKIENYLSVRNEINIKNIDYLFLDSKGNNITTHGVRYIMNKYVRSSNIKVKVTPHVLRHTFATDMLNEGADLKTVQELLGHENLSTTEIYTHVSNERLRRVYLESHPRARR